MKWVCLPGCHCPRGWPHWGHSHQMKKLERFCIEIYLIWATPICELSRCWLGSKVAGWPAGLLLVGASIKIWERWKLKEKMYFRFMAKEICAHTWAFNNTFPQLQEWMFSDYWLHTPRGSKLRLWLLECQGSTIAWFHVPTAQKRVIAGAYLYKWHAHFTIRRNVFSSNPK